MWVTSHTGQLYKRGCPVNHKQLHLHAHTRARLFWVKDGSARRHFYVVLHGWEDREFYQAKTVKTHSNSLVMLTHVQLKSFYCLSTCDITHMRKCTRPFPAYPYCKRQEAERGPGNETTYSPYSLRSTVVAEGLVGLNHSELMLHSSTDQVSCVIQWFNQLQNLWTTPNCT